VPGEPDVICGKSTGPTRADRVLPQGGVGAGADPGAAGAVLTLLATLALYAIFGTSRLQRGLGRK